MNATVKPLGVRHNNPGNIERGAPWQGLSAEQKHHRFCTFDSPEYGIRALAKILQTYEKKYGVNTIAEIISRWAPSNENNTRAYIEAVSRRTGLGHRQIDPHHYPTMKLLVEAIVFHENGMQPYSGDTIEAGLKLAGVRA